MTQRGEVGTAVVVIIALIVAIVTVLLKDDLDLKPKTPDINIEIKINTEEKKEPPPPYKPLKITGGQDAISRIFMWRRWALRIEDEFSDQHSPVYSDQISSSGTVSSVP